MSKFIMTTRDWEICDKAREVYYLNIRLSLLVENYAENPCMDRAERIDKTRSAIELLKSELEVLKNDK